MSYRCNIQFGSVQFLILNRVERYQNESTRQFSYFFFPPASLREKKSISRVVSSKITIPLLFYFSSCFFFLRSASLRASWNMKQEKIIQVFQTLTPVTISKETTTPTILPNTPITHIPLIHTYL